MLSQYCWFVCICCSKFAVCCMIQAGDSMKTFKSMQVDRCHVVQVKDKPSTYGYVGMQLGFGQKPVHRTAKPQLGHFSKAGLPPKRFLYEFQVTPDAVLPPGTELRARHFVPGQFVDIQGTT